MKNPLTPAGIEPATFRFVAQHLNHCATAVPWVQYSSLCNAKASVPTVSSRHMILNKVYHTATDFVGTCINSWSTFNISFLYRAVSWDKTSHVWQIGSNAAIFRVDPKNLPPFHSAQNVEGFNAPDLGQLELIFWMKAWRCAWKSIDVTKRTSAQSILFWSKATCFD